MFEHNLSWKGACDDRGGLAQDELRPPFTAHTALLDTTCATHVSHNIFKTWLLADGAWHTLSLFGLPEKALSMGKVSLGLEQK